MTQRHIRARLLRLPQFREPKPTYETLLIEVIDRERKTWAVPTLGEGIAHLRSNDGSALSITMQHLDDDTGGPDNSAIVLARDGDKIVLDTVLGGQWDLAGFAGDYDLTRDHAVRHTDGVVERVIDLTLDSVD